MESFLSGGIGVELVVDGVGSVLVEVFGATDPTSEENPASKARNLLDTKSLILKSSFFLSLKILFSFANSCPSSSRQNF